MPRWVDCGRVTFKYGLGEEFIDVLKTLHKLGLDSTEPVRVRGVEVAPRDVVAAALPDPATLGDRMTGKTCAGTTSPAPARTAGRGRPTSTTSPTTSRRCASTATRRSCCRRRSTRSSRWSCSRPARGGRRRARPRGVPGGAVPRAARRLRLAARNRGAAIAILRRPAVGSADRSDREERHGRQQGSLTPDDRGGLRRREGRRRGRARPRACDRARPRTARARQRARGREGVRPGLPERVPRPRDDGRPVVRRGRPGRDALDRARHARG